MNNTVLVESKIRQKLKLACALMCVFCLFFIAFVVVTVMIDRQNLNGLTNEVTGTLTEVHIDDTNTLSIDGDKHYNVVWNVEESDVNLEDYLNKTVTLTVTRDTFASSNPWVLGLALEGQTVVDYHTTLEAKTAENNELKTAFIAVTAVLCVATCGLFIWRFNVRPLVERELYGEFAEFLSLRQPVCKQRKVFAIYLGTYCAVLIALLITAVVLDPQADTIPELMPAAKAVLWTLLAVGIAGGIGLFVLKQWVTFKEIDFYAESLPFDFSDISHAPLRKKVKAELQKEILKDREEHPHTYADGGNGYDVTFGEEGLTLTVPFDDEIVFERHYDPTPTMPDAEAVFGNDTPSSNAEASDTAASKKERTMLLSYEQLNFEALAHFRKGSRPMMIIVKSRLNRTDDFPEEFVNDIHIALDLNLMNTLKTFNVEVENLTELLNNSKQLMLENCLIFRKKKGKITK